MTYEGIVLEEADGSKYPLGMEPKEMLVWNTAMESDDRCCKQSVVGHVNGLWVSPSRSEGDVSLWEHAAEVPAKDEDGAGGRKQEIEARLAELREITDAASKASAEADEALDKAEHERHELLAELRELGAVSELARFRDSYQGRWVRLSPDFTGEVVTYMHVEQVAPCRSEGRTVRISFTGTLVRVCSGKGETGVVVKDNHTAYCDRYPAPDDMPVVDDVREIVNRELAKAYSQFNFEGKEA